MLKKLSFYTIIGLLIFALGIGSWFVVAESIEATSHISFCGSCHTMSPMIQAYENDVHGGANKFGVQAVCTSCHLPHDNKIQYLIAKGRTGFHDVWAQLTYDLEAIDWEAKREEREHYVYDSGCMHCHVNLEKATLGNNKAFVAHKPYFLGRTDKTCVSCHPHVGHARLSEFLNSATSSP